MTRRPTHALAVGDAGAKFAASGAQNTKNASRCLSACVIYSVMSACGKLSVKRERWGGGGGGGAQIQAVPEAWRQYIIIQGGALMWRPGAVLIKTLTMQAEWPCRNGGFEESVNAPFRGGGPEITANATITHSEASVTK